MLLYFLSMFLLDCKLCRVSRKSYKSSWASKKNSTTPAFLLGGVNSFFQIKINLA